jgi:hypothetical protein
MLYKLLKCCFTEPTNIYYFATYKRVFLTLKSSTNEKLKSEGLFYEKEIYCAQLQRSTYNKYKDECDKLYNKYKGNELKLHNNEVIEDLKITKTIVLNKYPNVADINEEIDAYTYIQNYATSYEWTATSSVLWTKWCIYHPQSNQI